MPWHLNEDRPVYTRYPEPDGWGRTVTSTWQAMSLPPALELMCNAVHEAGHAAMMLHHGIQVKSMVLYTEEEARDKDFRAATDCGHYEVDYTQFACVLAAGERAQDRWLRQEGLWTPERAWSVERHGLDDRAEIEKVISTQLGGRLTYGEDPGHHFDYHHVCDRTDQALTPLWKGVLAIARELVKRRTLTGAQVTAAFTSAK